VSRRLNRWHALMSKLGMIRLLSSAQWQQDKRMAALDARRQQLNQTRQIIDVAQLLQQLDVERQVYGQQAFNAWLQKRSLTAAPPVVDRLEVSTTALCSRSHPVITDGIFI